MKPIETDDVIDKVPAHISTATTVDCNIDLFDRGLLPRTFELAWFM
jgi:hypothetical protein